mmetsp:Transcript_24384/g.27685  ORF Transcript_24384/g.27685 Transcript_24384/m.27685 type:complete len:351 (-) Transcript_24384:106-1158(-)
MRAENYEKIYYAGNMFKQSPDWGNCYKWQTRWCVLEETKLIYYQTKMKRKPKGIIDLQYCSLKIFRNHDEITDKNSLEEALDFNEDGTTPFFTLVYKREGRDPREFNFKILKEHADNVRKEFVIWVKHIFERICAIDKTEVIDPLKNANALMMAIKDPWKRLEPITLAELLECANSGDILLKQTPSTSSILFIYHNEDYQIDAEKGSDHDRLYVLDCDVKTKKLHYIPLNSLPVDNQIYHYRKLKLDSEIAIAQQKNLKHFIVEYWVNYDREWSTVFSPELILLLWQAMGICTAENRKKIQPHDFEAKYDDILLTLTEGAKLSRERVLGYKSARKQIQQQMQRLTSIKKE